MRVVHIPLLMIVGALALAGCSAGAEAGDSESRAVVDEFLAHLEAGEATAAAALTDMPFPDELIDDSFYAASLALPSDARIVATEGSDGGPFTATVSYVLDDPQVPETLDVRVAEQAGEYTIIGWTDDLPLTVGPFPAAGVIEVNGLVDYTLADAGNELLLLPGLYSFSYDDPTGLLRLSDGTESPFEVRSPRSSDIGIVPAFLPDVVPSVTAEIERLQVQCGEAGFTGPSCPPELTQAAALSPVASPASADWFLESGLDIVFDDSGYRASATYLVQSDQLTADVTATYTGAVSRDAAGTVVFTPEW